MHTDLLTYLLTYMKIKNLSENSNRQVGLHMHIDRFINGNVAKLLGFVCWTIACLNFDTLNTLEILYIMNEIGYFGWVWGILNKMIQCLKF